MCAQTAPASAAPGPESAFSWATQDIIRPHLQCELLTSPQCLPCVASPGQTSASADGEVQTGL